MGPCSLQNAPPLQGSPIPPFFMPMTAEEKLGLWLFLGLVQHNKLLLSRDAPPPHPRAARRDRVQRLRMGRGLITLWVLLLTGCSPYWIKSSEPLPLCFAPVMVKEPMQCAYAHSANGCTHRFPTCAIVIVREGSPQETTCRLNHEMAHVAGWNHDERDTYREDCGP